MDPARMFKESLTSRPELENSLGPKLNCAIAADMSASEGILLQNSGLCRGGALVARVASATALSLVVFSVPLPEVAGHSREA